MLFQKAGQTCEGRVYFNITSSPVQFSKLWCHLLKFELWDPWEGKKIMDENQAIHLEHLNLETPRDI